MYAAASASARGFYLVVVGILLAENQKIGVLALFRCLLTYRCLPPAEKRSGPSSVSPPRYSSPTAPAQLFARLERYK